MKCPINKTARNALQLVGRLFLGGVFIESGVSKLFHMTLFTDSVLAYKVLPEILAQIYAKMLPWVEIIAGTYLIIGLFTSFAAGLIGLMMLSFIIAISIVLIRGDAVDCGCFIGGKVEPVSPKKLIEDIGYFVLCLYLTFAPPGLWSIDNILNKETPDALCKRTKSKPTLNPEEA